MLNDKLLDPTTGQICFDAFNFDGLLGDVQLANGIVQPFLSVNKRRYRFRVLNGGPSRFYELFLTDPLSPNNSTRSQGVCEDAWSRTGVDVPNG